MDIKYRIANENDIEDLVDFRLKLNNYEYGEEKIENEDQLRKNIREVLKKELNRTIYFFIALDGDKVIAGSAIIIQRVIPFYTIPNGKIGFITSVFTDEEYRRRGIQKELIKMTLDLGEKQECKRIELNATNPHAVKLYESFGFKRMDIKFRLEIK